MESTAKKNYTLPIIMMVALFFMISFVTGLQNPFGIIVKNQFAASNFMSQLVTQLTLSPMPSWVFRPVCYCRRSVTRKPLC